MGAWLIVGRGPLNTYGGEKNCALSFLRSPQLPSPLKTEMEQKNVVVCSGERKQADELPFLETERSEM